MRGLSQPSLNLPDGVFADCSTWEFDALFSVSAGVKEIIKAEGYTLWFCKVLHSRLRNAVQAMLAEADTSRLLLPFEICFQEITL